MKVIRKCSKGGGCNNWATHVLVYIHATTFKEISDHPKPYCHHHALAMHVKTSAKQGLQSRIFTMDEWMRKLEQHKKAGGNIINSKV